MKLRFSPIILSVLILSLALQPIALPVYAQSEPNLSQVEIESLVIPQKREQPSYPDKRDAQPYPEDLFESGEHPDAIPPSPEIIAKTQEQVNSFDCASVTDVSQIECEALVDLYDSTNGADWLDNSNWLESAKVREWYGVIVTLGTGVTQLSLNSNHLTGTIPSTLDDLSNLLYLHLHFNQLEGGIPSSLGDLSNLLELYLNDNQLEGSIPLSLGNLSNLKILFLRNNHLEGSIPSTLGNLSNLEALYLYSNQLTGNIPAELGNLSKLWYLLLQDNQLTGSIPSTLGNLSDLRRLYIYDNQLTGSIPSTLGNLSNLDTLRLNHNQLTGRIPLSFVKLTKLNYFNYYGNNLCEPATPEFIAWKNTVEEWLGPGIICESRTCLPLIFR